MDTYTLMVFVLLIVGLGIIVSEIFIPSAGILSLLATACFVGSAFCAYKAWYDQGEVATFWIYLGSMIVGIPAFIGFGLHLLPKTELGNQLLAGPQDLQTLTPFQEEEQRLASMIDEQGTALTLFSPGGMVQLGREKFHAESEGVMVDQGTEVVVVGVKGNRLVVRPLSLHQTAASSKPETQDVASAEPATESFDGLPAETETTDSPEVTSQPEPDSGEAPIDFDIPETA